MTHPPQRERTERALLAVLERNRGELDAAALDRLLARLETRAAAPPTPASPVGAKRG